MARLSIHQMRIRSIEPSIRATNELSSRNGRKTARFVAPDRDSRAYASGVVNSDRAASTTPECATTAKTCLKVASPPIMALKTANAMPAMTRPPTARLTNWMTGAP